jgi:hypothetical protein
MQFVKTEVVNLSAAKRRSRRISDDDDASTTGDRTPGSPGSELATPSGERNLASDIGTPREGCH